MSKTKFCYTVNGNSEELTVDTHSVLAYKQAVRHLTGIADKGSILATTEKNTNSKIVSFRAECDADVFVLIESLKKNNESKNKFNIMGITPITDSDADVKVQMQLALPFTADMLDQAMRKIPDGHVMYRTLMEVPLTENDLKERLSSLASRDWSKTHHLIPRP